MNHLHYWVIFIYIYGNGFDNAFSVHFIGILFNSNLAFFGVVLVLYNMVLYIYRKTTNLF